MIHALYPIWIHVLVLWTLRTTNALRIGSRLPRPHPESNHRWFFQRTPPQIVTFPKNHNSTAIHRHFMNLTLQKASRGFLSGEVPIAATVVRRSTPTTFEILSSEHNRVETLRDASAHGEMLALRRAASRIGNWRIENSTLYSTLEPCPMCLAAIQAFRVDGLVYAAPDVRLGAVESYMEMLERKHPYHELGCVVGGVYKERSAWMMREFFRARRGKKKKKRYERVIRGNRFGRWIRYLFKHEH